MRQWSFLFYWIANIFWIIDYALFTIYWVHFWSMNTLYSYKYAILIIIYLLYILVGQKYAPIIFLFQNFL